MSTRDELAKRLAIESALDGPSDETVGDFGVRLANVVHAEGWRKMPSRDEIASALEASDPEGGSVPDEGEGEFSYWYDQADAVLALMDGGQ